MEVTKAETITISAFVASHYIGGKNCVVQFTSEDREEIEKLPSREKEILSKYLRVPKEALVNILAPLPPKTTVPEKLKATAKKATRKSTKKPATKKATTKKATAKAETATEEE